MDIRKAASELLSCLGPGKMSPSAYDTAWVARLGEIAPDLSNRAIEWLSNNQLPDGSWGAPAPLYYHDRVISTLAAMIVLTRRGRRAHDRIQIEKGLKALDNITSTATQKLMSDPNGATIGFEMIVPTMISEAEELGIIRQQGERILGRLSLLRKIKMDKMQGRKVNRYVTMAFSAEMAGLDRQGMLDVDQLQEENGSVGHSPSATAYFAAYVRPEDRRSLAYLREVIATDGSVPDLFPFEIYERAWVLWNLALIGDSAIHSLPDFQKHLDFLESAWHPEKGVSLSTGFSVPDGDNTSIVFELLRKMGRNVDEKGLLSFAGGDHFRCYDLEANASVSVNIHALAALRQLAYPPDHPIVIKAMLFLEQNQVKEGYWFDKWHISPYYTTAHAILALAGSNNPSIQTAISWIIKTQSPDGSWGFYSPTAEETAYCLQALCICRKRGYKINKETIAKGRTYLLRNMPTETTYPLFWIGKGLYASEFIVRSEILSALALSEAE